MSNGIRIEQLEYRDPRWPDFVLRFPWANAFHSPEFNTTISISEGFEAVPLFALSGERIVACAFPVVVSTDLPLPGRLGRRILLYGSPLSLPTDEGRAGVEKILEAVRNLTGKQALFAEIRNNQPFPDDEVPGDEREALMSDWDYIPRENYLIDLSLGEEELSRRLSSGTRKNIRRSERNGCEIREIQTVEEFQTAVDLIQELYHRKKVPMVHPSLLLNAHKQLSGSGLLRAASVKRDSDVLGVRLTLNYARTVYDWYAAAAPGSAKNYPNEALVWDVIRWGISHGYQRFDFGGGGIPGKYYGPARFKEKFKGDKVQYGRYRWTRHRMLLKMMEAVYEWRVNRGSAPKAG